jgi:hypothetical protein
MKLFNFFVIAVLILFSASTVSYAFMRSGGWEGGRLHGKTMAMGIPVSS